MKANELEIFLKNCGQLYKMSFAPTEARTVAWTQAFKGIDYQMGMRMANLFYTKGMKDRYRDVTPNDLFTMRNEAMRALGRVEQHEQCAYCGGTGMINVKRYCIGIGWLDFAFGCFCSNGNKVAKVAEPLDKRKISDYETIQKKPMRLADVYMYKGRERTSELVTMDLLEEVKHKFYSKEEIDNIKNVVQANAKKYKERTLGKW